MNKTCELIKELRIQSGLTAVQFSKVMGVSKASISKWENDELPGIDKLYEIARYFRVTVQELLDGALETDGKDTRLEDSYDLTPFDTKKMIEERDEDKLVLYYKKCQNIMTVFLRLLPLSAYSKLTTEDITEFKYLLKYISLNEEKIAYRYNYNLMYGKDIDPNLTTSLHDYFESINKLSKAEKEWEIRKIVYLKPGLLINDLLKADLLKPFIEAFKLLSQQLKDYYFTQIIYKRRHKLSLMSDDFVLAMINGGARMLVTEDFSSSSEIWGDDIVKFYRGTITNIDVSKRKGYPLFGSIPDYSFAEHNELVDKEYTSLLKEACLLRRSNPLEYYKRLKSGKYDRILDF